MPVKKDKSPGTGWDSDPTAAPPVPNDQPTDLEELDFSDPPPDEPPQAAAGLQFVSPPVQQVPLPTFKPPEAPAPDQGKTASPETILFNEPTPAPPPEPAPAASPAPVANITVTGQGKTEMTMMLEIVSQLVQRQQQQPVVMHTGGAVDLEQVMVTLLSTPGVDQYLPAIREIAKHQTQDSLACFVLALVNLHGDRGTLGEIAYNPDWQLTVKTTQLAAGGYVPPVISTCEYCGHAYRPPLGGNVRQRFCCNVCGKKAAGYQDEPLPHAPECTTEPGKLLQQALASSKAAA